MAVSPCGEKTMAPPAISSDAKRNASSGSSSVTLHLDLDDLLNPDIANDLHHDRRREHHLAHMLAKQRLHVFRVDERERDRQKRRQREQHPPGEATVRSVDPHLPPNLESLADDVREVVENLRKIAAGLSLNQDGSDEKADVEHLDAIGELTEGLAPRQPV